MKSRCWPLSGDAGISLPSSARVQETTDLHAVTYNPRLCIPSSACNAAKAGLRHRWSAGSMLYPSYMPQGVLPSGLLMALPGCWSGSCFQSRQQHCTAQCVALTIQASHPSQRSSSSVSQPVSQPAADGPISITDGYIKSLHQPVSHFARQAQRQSLCQQSHSQIGRWISTPKPGQLLALSTSHDRWNFIIPEHAIAPNSASLRSCGD
jgi:hypothetical protein